MSVELIKTHIIEFIKSKMSEEELNDVVSKGDFDLIASGLISSLEFMELISSIEEKHGIQIDFEEFDPASYTSINGLASLAATQRSN